MNNNTTLITKSYGAVLLNYLRNMNWVNVDIIKFGADHVFSPELYYLRRTMSDEFGSKTYACLWVDCRESLLAVNNRKAVIFPSTEYTITPPQNMKYSNYLNQLLKSGTWNTLANKVREFYYIDYVREFESEVHWNSTDKYVYDLLFNTRLAELTRR